MGIKKLREQASALVPKGSMVHWPNMIRNYFHDADCFMGKSSMKGFAEQMHIYALLGYMQALKIDEASSKAEQK